MWPRPLWRVVLLIALDCFFLGVNLRVFTYLFLILSSSSRVLCLAFLSRIYIAVASLLNGMIDILLDFHVMCPWNFSFFISLSFFLCRDLCTDIWLVWRLRRWLETKEIGPKVSFYYYLHFLLFIICFVIGFLLFIVCFWRFTVGFYRLSGQLIIGWYGWI